MYVIAGPDAAGLIYKAPPPVYNGPAGGRIGLKSPPIVGKGVCPAMLSRNAEFNAVNRGVYIADNLDFLRSLNTASVDLVCIDPPFAKSDTFVGDKLRPPLSADERENEMRLLHGWGIATPEQADAAGIAWPDDPKARGGYKDTWAWDEDIHEDWVTGIETTHPAVGKLLDATRYIHGEDTAAYLSFMAIRLIEIHRVLKPTGSLFLHCDHTASGYLRQLLDGVFGKDNFRNEIVWHYNTGGASRRHFSRKHDTIFYYAKSSACRFNTQREAYREEATNHFKETDDQGRAYRIRTLGGKDYRYYKDEGRVCHDVWDINTLNAVAKERTGYPTQKPAVLAERIIRASTNPGDVVLDCFAGCAYAAVAAERIRQSDPEQERIWAACDLNLRAWTVFKRQFNKGGDLPLLTCNDQTTGQQVLGCEPTVTLHGPAELPTRTTSAEVEIKPMRTASPRDRRYKRASTLMTDRAMLIALLQFSAGRAWCCGYISDNLDHSLAYGNYELDHVIPKSAGGTDEIENRAPLCSAHNGLKGNRDITLVELRYEVIERGELKVPARSLPKLSDAFEYALRVKQEAYQRKFGRPLGI